MSKAKDLSIHKDTSKYQCMICLDDEAPAYIHGPCNHIVTCGPCYLLHKMKYEKNNCMLCAQSLNEPLICSYGNIQGSFSDYEFGNFAYSRKICCYFDSRDVMKEYEASLNYTCSECHQTFPSLSELKKHAGTHDKQFCNICLQKRKVFPKFQRLYSSKDFLKHRSNGDPAQGIEGAIPAHIKCNLCGDWSYDRDDYVQHMLMNHHCCQLCKRRGTEVWLKGQPELIAHYSTDHLVCDFEDCCSRPLENVYEDEWSLQSHIITVHGKSVSKQERKAAARINIDFGSSRPPTTTATSIRHSTSASSLDHIQGSSSEKHRSTSTTPSKDILSELQTLLGSEFPGFHKTSVMFFNKEITAEDYYNEFCNRVLKFSGAPLLWIQLVESLPDFSLREQLHKAHHDAVKVGRGLNRKPSDVPVTLGPPPAVTVTRPVQVSPNESQQQVIWSSPPVAASSTSNKSTGPNVRQKQKQPGKKQSVWAAVSADPPPTPFQTQSQEPKKLSTQTPTQNHMNSLSGWPREMFSTSDFPVAQSSKKKGPVKLPVNAPGWTASASSSSSKQQESKQPARPIELSMSDFPAAQPSRPREEFSLSDFPIAQSSSKKTNKSVVTPIGGWATAASSGPKPPEPPPHPLLRDDVFDVDTTSEKKKGKKKVLMSLGLRVNV